MSDNSNTAQLFYDYNIKRNLEKYDYFNDYERIDEIKIANSKIAACFGQKPYNTFSLSIFSFEDMKIIKEINFFQQNLNQFAKRIFIKDQNTILCGLNFKNIRIIDLNDMSD